MFYRGDRVLIYNGTIDVSGIRTSVEVGTIEEVGEYELLVYFDSSRSWSGPKKISKERCMPIVRTFDQPSQPPVPSVCDLVMVYDYDIVTKELKKVVGNVQMIEYFGASEKVKIMFKGQLKSFDLKKCFIIQRASKKTEDVDEIGYINNVTDKKKALHDKEIESTQTIPINRDTGKIQGSR